MLERRGGGAARRGGAANRGRGAQGHTDSCCSLDVATRTEKSIVSLGEHRSEHRADLSLFCVTSLISNMS